MYIFSRFKKGYMAVTLCGQCFLAMSIFYEVGIDLCAFQAAMPQEPADLFQGHAVL